jgi:hypothetical protein
MSEFPTKEQLLARLDETMARLDGDPWAQAELLEMTLSHLQPLMAYVASEEIQEDFRRLHKGFRRQITELRALARAEEMAKRLGPERYQAHVREQLEDLRAQWRTQARPVTGPGDEDRDWDSDEEGVDHA